MAKQGDDIAEQLANEIWHRSGQPRQLVADLIHTASLLQLLYGIDVQWKLKPKDEEPIPLTDEQLAFLVEGVKCSKCGYSPFGEI